MSVSMHLENPEQANILGLKPAKPKITNLFYIATELDREGKRKEAEQIYSQLLDSDFSNPILHAALGMNYANQEKNGLAYLLLTKALDNIEQLFDAFKRLGVIPKAETTQHEADFIRGKKSEIYNAIGTCWKHENKTEEARKYFLLAQDQIPLNADIQNNLGTLHINEGDPAKALEYMNLALTIDPQHGQARWNKSLAHLELGQYEEGWKYYDDGFGANVRADRNYLTRNLPFWDGSPGKTVVVYGEQGIGDEIMFASCLPDMLKDCKQVVFDCHKKLHTLFANSFPELPIYPTREDEMLMWPCLPNGAERYPFDAKIAIGSLPKFYRPTLESFPGTPYIKPTVANEAECAIRLSRLGERPKIGIAWRGGHKKTRIDVRSILLEQLLPILQQNADFISLQYDDCTDEVTAFEAKHNIKLNHWPELVASNNYDDTAGLIANLDLVITVCCSAVHLSGSMGVPAWVMTPSRPAWRYRLDLDYMPWYGKTCTLFRQAPQTTDWQPVIEEVASNLAALLTGDTSWQNQTQKLLSDPVDVSQP